MNSIEDIVSDLEDLGFLDNQVSGEETPSWLCDENKGISIRAEELPDNYELDLKQGYKNEKIDSLSDQENGFLGENMRGKIESEVKDIGNDALAYYIPYHIDSEKWGIYFRETGLLYLADFLIKNGISRNQALQNSGKKLKLHEEMHFMVETVCSNQELIIEESIYSGRNASDDEKEKQIGRDTDLNMEQFEEALANANALWKFSGTVETILTKFTLEKQPDGYKHWKEVSWKNDFIIGCKDFFRSTVSPEVSNKNSRWYPYLSWSRDKVSNIPHYIVRDADERIKISEE